MKYLCISLLLGSLLHGPHARAAESDLNLGLTDRKLHFMMAYGLTLTSSELLRKTNVPLAPLISGAIVLGLSWIKEKTDSTYSSGDMKASALGVGSACFMSYVIHL